MSPEIVAFAIAFLIGVFAGVQFEKSSARERRARWRRQNPRGEVHPPHPKHDPVPLVDAADQLRTVMMADFKPQRLLNKSETRLFKAIDKWVIEARPGWQVMAQVSLGEILKCEDKAAYACINSKRVDLLIVDDECRPLHAIEYQGGAHFKGAHATAARSRRKRFGERGLAMSRWWRATRRRSCGGWWRGWCKPLRPGNCYILISGRSYCRMYLCSNA